MPGYPTITFPNIDAVRSYLNTYIVTNGVGAIEGVEHNNIENALIDFIIYSVLNSQKVALVSTTGSYQAVNGITRFYNQVPANVVFGDNFWNEWVFVNATSSVIPFSTGLGYFDLEGVFHTNIPTKSLIRISKATNGQWIQTGNFGDGASSINASWINFNTVVGHPELAVGDDAVTPNNGDTVVVIQAQIQPKSELMFYDGVEVKLTPMSDFSYLADYGTSTTTYTFNQAFSDLRGFDFHAVKKITDTPSSGSPQAEPITVGVHGSTIPVPVLGTFISLNYAGQVWIDPQVTQEGSNLNLSGIGSDFFGEKMLVWYYP